MKNFVQEGKYLDYTNETGNTIASGDVVIAGSLPGVAVADILDTEVGAIQTQGVFKLDKEASLAITMGEEVYWNTTNKEVTKTATDVPLGVAAADAAGADTTVHVKLAGGGNGTATAATVAALTDNSGGAAADGTIGVVTAPTALTDNSGGTASGTLALIDQTITGVDGTGSNAASVTEVNAQLVIIANSIASLAARQAEDRAAIISLTDAVKELSTKQNAVITSLKNAGLMAS